MARCRIEIRALLFMELDGPPECFYKHFRQFSITKIGKTFSNHSVASLPNVSSNSILQKTFAWSTPHARHYIGSKQIELGFVWEYYPSEVEWRAICILFRPLPKALCTFFRSKVTFGQAFKHICWLSSNLACAQSYFIFQNVLMYSIVSGRSRKHPLYAKRSSLAVVFQTRSNSSSAQ